MKDEKIAEIKEKHKIMPLAQEYIKKYFLKDTKKIEVKKTGVLILDGELVVEDYDELTEIDLRGHELTKLVVRNCQNLKEIYVSNNQIVEITIGEYVPNLHTLSCSGNILTKGIEGLENSNVYSLNAGENFPISKLISEKIQLWEENKELSKIKYQYEELKTKFESLKKLQYPQSNQENEQKSKMKSDTDDLEVESKKSEQERTEKLEEKLKTTGEEKAESNLREKQNSKSDLERIENILTNLRDDKGELNVGIIYEYKNNLSELEDVNKRNENLQSILGTLEPQNRFLREDIEKQKGEIANKDAQINVFEDRITKLSSDINELDKKIRELEKNADENEEEIRKLKRERGGLEEDLDIENKKLKKTQKEKQELINQLSTLQEQLPVSNLPTIIIPETERIEVNNFLQNYIEAMSNDYQAIIDHPDFQKEKDTYSKQQGELKAEIVQIINKINNWGK